MRESVGTLHVQTIVTKEKRFIVVLAGVPEKKELVEWVFASIIIYYEVLKMKAKSHTRS